MKKAPAKRRSKRPTQKPSATPKPAPSKERFITPKTFIERVGCGASQVSKWCKEGKIHKDGKHIDWEHPKTKAHLRSLASSQDSRRVPYEPDPDDDLYDDSPGATTGGLPENFEGSELIGNMTLEQITEQFGGVAVLNLHLKAWDMFQSARKKKISSDKAEARLVSRDLVLQVFSHWEQANQKLLSELPKAITSDIYAHATTGDPIHVAENAVQKLVSEILARAKLKVKKGLAGLNEDDGVEVFSPAEDVG